MPPTPIAGAQPVRFDDQAAALLAALLDDTSQMLRALARSTDEDATTARSDWSGFTRTWFDDRLGLRLIDVRLAAASMSRAAALVRQSAVQATALQDRRNAEALRARQADIRRLEAAMASAHQ